jgi:uncharacterized protein YceH (UPF0502 family)
MTTLVPFVRQRELDDDRRAALRHLDDDLRAVTRSALARSAEARQTLDVLRRRALAVYRIALARAAGIPQDRVWTLLSLSVAAFVAFVSELGDLDAVAQPAQARLRALALDYAEVTTAAG